MEEQSLNKDRKVGFFSRLKERLKKTKVGVFNKIKKAISFKGKLDEELLEQIEEILVQADVGVATALQIIDNMRQNEQACQADSADEIISLFKQSVLNIISQRQRKLVVPENIRPFVILIVGVNGVGKTTTIAKIAQRFKQDGKKVMMVAGDTFRAAAIEQLEIWAQRTGSEFIHQSMGADPAAVCYDAINAARSRNIDVVIIDTAGRLHTKVNLMEEMKKIDRVIKKLIPEAPHETILILDATTGQNAVNQAQMFSQAINISGIIMTKLDGTAKGGTLISICDQYDMPILMIGVGETMDDLQDFEPTEYLEALFAD